METDFILLSNNFQAEENLANLLEKIQADWEEVGHVIADILAFRESNNTARQAEAQSRFESLQAAINARIGTINAIIESDLDRDYLDASRGFERAEWISGIAAGFALLLMALGVYIFNRSIILSLEKLVEGAELFAFGHRDHVIEVQVPRELNRVAEEFNKMIKVIQVSEKKLVDQARRDKLTGLLNRRAFEESMSEANARLQRLDEKFALVTLDIDHFKAVNDTYGHATGDQVLVAVARIMLESVRSIDGVFRCGGEEFSILLPGADASAAQATAERIRLAIEEQIISSNDQQIQVTASLGIAVALTSEQGQSDELQRRADAALYKAKETGRNRVVTA